MIGQSDLDAMTETLATADRVAARVRRGVVPEREATTAEWLQVLRGYELCRDAMLLLMRQEQDRARSAMALYDRQGRESG